MASIHTSEKNSKSLWISLCRLHKRLHLGTWQQKQPYAMKHLVYPSTLSSNVMQPQYSYPTTTEHTQQQLESGAKLQHKLLVHCWNLWHLHSATGTVLLNLLLQVTLYCHMGEYADQQIGEFALTMRKRPMQAVTSGNLAVHTYFMQHILHQWPINVLCNWSIISESLVVVILLITPSIHWAFLLAIASN